MAGVRITEVWAFVTVNGDGDEVLMWVHDPATGRREQALVTEDDALPKMREAAIASGLPVRLLHWTMPSEERIA